MCLRAQEIDDNGGGVDGGSGPEDSEMTTEASLGDEE